MFSHRSLLANPSKAVRLLLELALMRMVPYQGGEGTSTESNVLGKSLRNLPCGRGLRADGRVPTGGSSLPALAGIHDEESPRDEELRR